MNAVDISARLLANENLTVVRRKVDTASFDVKNRVLTIPQFKNLDPVVEDLFVCHEIGHALFTDLKTMESFFAISDNRKYHAYFNVVEDPRIERKVKERYPGSRKSFFEGYKKLKEDDFFKIDDVPSEERALADRINLFYKGMGEHVEFYNDVENDFCRRVGAVDTMQEAFDLAVELYNYDEQNYQNKYEDDSHAFDAFDDADKQDQQTTQSPQSTNSEDKSKSDDQQEEGGESSNNKSENQRDGQIDDDQSKKSEDSDSDGEDSDDESDDESDESNFDPYAQNGFDGSVKSQQDLNKSFESFADADIEWIDIQLVNKKGFCPIIGYKKVLQETAFADIERPADAMRYVKRYEGTQNEEAFKKYVDEFKLEAKQLISYLKKEFDLKKSAETIKRTVVNKTGQLDMRKIYAHQIKDDIFRKTTIVKDAKNHGMVFLLDWSSSMFAVMQKTIEQVYILASFCKACNIPFRVFAFSSTHRKEAYFCGLGTQNRIGTHDEQQSSLDIKDGRMYSLLEFFNNSMTTQEFNTMANRLLRTTVWDTRYKTAHNSYYELNSTPFNSALAYMNFYIPEFKSKLNLEKVTIVTLTDGVSHTLRYGGVKTFRTGYSYISPNTKKRYELCDTDKNRLGQGRLADAIIESKVLVNMLQDSGNVVVGLNIAEPKYQAVQSALSVSTCSWKVTHERILAAKKEHSYVVNDSFYDLCVIFPKMLKDEEEAELSDKLGEFTAKGIAKQFMKNNKDKKKKRAFLDAFISTIA